jgi:hypothetical protein
MKKYNNKVMQLKWRKISNKDGLAAKIREFIEKSNNRTYAVLPTGNVRTVRVLR